MVWVWRLILVGAGAWALNRGADTADAAAGNISEGIGKGLDKALALAAVGGTVYAVATLFRK